MGELTVGFLGGLLPFALFILTLAFLTRKKEKERNKTMFMRFVVKDSREIWVNIEHINAVYSIENNLSRLFFVIGKDTYEEVVLGPAENIAHIIHSLKTEYDFILARDWDSLKDFAE